MQKAFVCLCQLAHMQPSESNLLAEEQRKCWSVDTVPLVVQEHDFSGEPGGTTHYFIYVMPTLVRRPAWCRCVTGIEPMCANFKTSVV